MNDMMGKKCGCPHHKVFSALIILFALDFFLGAIGVLTQGFVNLSWPILVGVAGLMKLSGGKCKCCEGPMQK